MARASHATGMPLSHEASKSECFEGGMELTLWEKMDGVGFREMKKLVGETGQELKDLGKTPLKTRKRVWKLRHRKWGHSLDFQSNETTKTKQPFTSTSKLYQCMSRMEMKITATTLDDCNYPRLQGRLAMTAILSS